MRVCVNYKEEHVLQVPFLLEKAFTEIKGVEVVGVAPHLTEENMLYIANEIIKCRNLL